MRGVRKLTKFTRKVAFMKGSRLDLRAPSLSQTFKQLQPGGNGENGKHGAHGPRGSVMIRSRYPQNII